MGRERERETDRARERESASAHIHTHIGGVHKEEGCRRLISGDWEGNLRTELLGPIVTRGEQSIVICLPYTV